jgi:TonB family protein
VTTVAAAPEPAPPPAIALGYLGPQVTIEHMLVVLRDDPQPGTAHIVLSLAATHAARRELAATIRLPAGTRVTGFAFASGDGERRVAYPMPARQAGEAYAAVKDSHENALAAAAGPDALALRVPIAADRRAELELELVLPPLSVLGFDPSGQAVRRAEIRVAGAPRQIWIDVSGRLTIALPHARPPGTASPLAGVSASTSLLVGAAPVILPPIVTYGCSVTGVGSRSIRRVVKQHHPQLKHCYMRVAQWDPRIAGTAILRFVIGEDGRVKSSSVGGDLGDAGIERCLADEVARWDFGAVPGGGDSQVTYPLTFRIAR